MTNHLIDFFVFFFPEILLIMFFLKSGNFSTQGDSNLSPLSHGRPPLPLGYALANDNITA
jgi:hypothetical protein